MSKRESRIRANRAMERRKRDFLAAYKLVVGCEVCGYNEHSCALDFDHISGEKEFSPNHLKYKGWATIRAELEKCQVLCSNCHRVRTFGQHARVVMA